MVRKFSALISILVFSFYIFPAYARADDIRESRINAASPLYFLKSIREILELKFATTSNAKAIRQLEFATRRIREVKSLSYTSHQDLIEPTLIMYLSHLQELTGKANLGDQILASQITEAVKAHMSLLQGVYNQVTDPRAKRSIRATIYSLSQWENKLISRLNSLNKYPLAQALTTSKLSSCQFLSKEASSSALNEVERAILAERAKMCLND